MAHYAPGDNVEVHSLNGRPELNGRMGMVINVLDPGSGRISVQVQGEPKPIALKPINLGDSGLPVGVKHFIAPAVPPEPAPGAAAASAGRPAGKKRKQQPAVPPEPAPAAARPAGKKRKQQPQQPEDSEELLRRRIRKIVARSDLSELTRRQIRDQLERNGLDVSDKRYINALISEEVESRREAEAADEPEEEEAEDDRGAETDDY